MNLKEISNEEKNYYLEQRAKIEKDFFEKSVFRKITITMCYFPKIKSKWDRVFSLHNRIVNLYSDQVLGFTVYNNSEYPEFIIPEDYNIEKYLEDLDILDQELANVMDKIQIEISEIIVAMEK